MIRQRARFVHFWTIFGQSPSQKRWHLCLHLSRDPWQSRTRINRERQLYLCRTCSGTGPDGSLRWAARSTGFQSFRINASQNRGFQCFFKLSEIIENPFFEIVRNDKKLCFYSELKKVIIYGAPDLFCYWNRDRCHQRCHLFCDGDWPKKVQK